MGDVTIEITNNLNEDTNNEAVGIADVVIKIDDSAECAQEPALEVLPGVSCVSEIT